MTTEPTPRPSIDQAVDAIETIAFSAYQSERDSFHIWWHINKTDDRVKSILREYAQKENGSLTEQIEHLTAEKNELVLNLEACEKERMEEVKKVVERDGLIMSIKERNTKLYNALYSLFLSVKVHPDYVDGVEGDEWHDLISIAHKALESNPKP